MLKLKDYSITYPNGLKLDYEDLHIRKGELVGLFGPSGCGKTSLLDSLFNPDFPGKVSCAEALLDGKPFPKAGRELYSLVSYCPQFSQAALNPKLTINDHVDLLYHGNKMKKDPERVKELLDALNLNASMLTRRPGGLSGGQQQRMVLMLCALKNPKLMILDEPSSAIDLITLQDIVSFLEHLKGETTMLMVAHSRPLLEHVADRIIDL